MSNKDRDLNYFLVDQFEGGTRKTWQESLMNKEFCDVTLSCENKQIQAHKIIISSNSVMFSNILRQDSNVHPIIYLRGVRYMDLQNLLTIMYEGEVSINKDDIVRFLNVAEDLQVKGLFKGHKDDKGERNGNSQTPLILNKINDEADMIDMDKISGHILNLNPENVNEEDNKNNTYVSEFDLTSKTDENNIKLKTVTVTGIKDEKSTYYNGIYEDNLFKKNLILKVKIEVNLSERLEKNKKYMGSSESLGLHEEKRKSDNTIDYSFQDSSIPLGNNDTLSYEEYFTINSSKLLKSEQFPCKNCEYKTEDKSKLQIHMNTIHKVQTFRCNKYSFETKATIRLKMHEEMFHTINHLCEKCDNVYKNKCDLKRHLDNIHMIKPTYQCKHCKHLAKNDYSLRRHVDLIHKENVYFCMPCNKQFLKRESLHRHQLSVHEGVRYSCDQCHVQVADKSTLRIHFQSIHEGVRLPCIHCDYKARSKNNLRKHVLSIHENGGSHQCEKCDFRAPDKSVLRAHTEATHEGILHPCNLCDFKGTRKGSLKNHIRVAHEGLRFLCDRCEYKGTAKSSLIEHIRRRH